MRKRKNRSKEIKKIREKKREEEKKAVWDPLLTLELFRLTCSNVFLLFAILITPIEDTRIISVYI